jgi:hypothetical protein
MIERWWFFSNIPSRGRRLFTYWDCLYLNSGTRSMCWDTRKDIEALLTSWLPASGSLASFGCRGISCILKSR